MASCEGWAFAGAFGSREFIGYDGLFASRAGWRYNGDCWHRLGGTKDDEVKRNVRDAFAATFAGTLFRHAGYGEGNTVLSPAPAAAPRLGGGYNLKIRVASDPAGHA